MATYNQSNMYFTANVNSGSNESNYAFPSSFMPVGQTISEEGVQDLLRTGQNMITIGQNMISNGERMILLAQGATATQGLQSAGVQPSWSTISTTETQQTGLTERPWPSKPPEQRFTSLSLSQDHDTTAPLPQYASPSGYLQTDPYIADATNEPLQGITAEAQHKEVNEELRHDTQRRQYEQPRHRRRLKRGRRPRVDQHEPDYMDLNLMQLTKPPEEYEESGCNFCTTDLDLDGPITGRLSLIEHTIDSDPSKRVKEWFEANYIFTQCARCYAMKFDCNHAIPCSECTEAGALCSVTRCEDVWSCSGLCQYVHDNYINMVANAITKMGFDGILTASVFFHNIHRWELSPTFWGGDPLVNLATEYPPPSDMATVLTSTRQIPLKLALFNLRDFMEDFWRKAQEQDASNLHEDAQNVEEDEVAHEVEAKQEVEETHKVKEPPARAPTKQAQQIRTRATALPDEVCADLYDYGTAAAFKKKEPERYAEAFQQWKEEKLKRSWRE